MKRRECFGLIVAEILKAKKEAQAIGAEIDRQRAIIDNPRKYAPDYIAAARGKLYSLQRDLEDIAYNHGKSVRAITDQMKETLNAEMELHGDDIHKDADLLKFKLSEQEYVELLNRHDGNATMQKLILKSAKEQNVDLGLVFVGNDAEMEQLRGLEYAAQTAMKHSTNEDVFNRLFGPDSASYRFWNVDDRERPAKRETVRYSDDRVMNAARILSDSRDLSDSVQADIVREFADRPGILAVLKDAARRGGKAEAVATIEELTGDKQTADFTRRAAKIRDQIGAASSEE